MESRCKQGVHATISRLHYDLFTDLCDAFVVFTNRLENREVPKRVFSNPKFITNNESDKSKRHIQAVGSVLYAPFLFSSALSVGREKILFHDELEGSVLPK